MDNFDMNLTEDQTEKVLQFQVGLRNTSIDKPAGIFAFTISR